jgi:uncharacterized OB-fold protein
VAYVEFDEAPGVRLITNLIDCRLEDTYIGMPVEVIFQRINDDITMPLVKPLKTKSS